LNPQPQPGTRLRRLKLDDVLVVAPYNAQVRLLESVLPRGARVGTVDRFQGQEAPVSIVSLTHSDFDDDSAAAAVAGGGAHGMPFVLNANRLNVALSRAQCLAIVVASPQLTQARARTLERQRQLNFHCRVVEAGSPDETGA
jgi:superfamily I DNA and/or RNA helicase